MADQPTPRIRVILASHGEQSKGMLNTVQMLLGPQENIAAYSLYPEQSVEDFSEALEKEIQTYGAENIIFLTELVYGSPFNTIVALTQKYDLHHISGTNMAVLMQVILARCDAEATLDDVVEAGMEGAEGSILDVRKLLAEAQDDEDEEE